uniref:VQ domain-containing protein n=1 Tax=Leersia perrieri TaxID=77586 RepID=A0A0D9X1P4_9ORYZ
MAFTSTTGDAVHSLPHSPATSPTSFLDIDDQTTAPSFYLPSGAFVAGTARDHHAPPSTLLPHAAAAAAGDDKPPPTRKRSRSAAASRRPPTTVLATDASNFRAMVQEFTGFPSPPPLSAALMMMPSPSHVFSGAASAAPATCAANTATSFVLDALALLAKTRAGAAAAAAPPISGSELYGEYGAGTFDGESAGVAGGGHELFSSTSQYAGERRY